MLNTIGDIKDEFLVRTQGNTSVAFITDTFINDWINQAHRFAASYHKWPFTEGRVSTTYTSANEEWSFENYKHDSFRLVQIGTKLLQKLNYEDYLIFKEEENDADDRVYSDFSNLLIINPNVDASGTLTAWGQYLPAPLDVTDTGALTVFSNREEEGNEAILQLMMSYAKTREKKETDAELHYRKATEILEGIWKRYLDEQAMYQTHPDRGGMFRRFDVLKGRSTEGDLIKRDQF